MPVVLPLLDGHATRFARLALHVALDVGTHQSTCRACKPSDHKHQRGAIGRLPASTVDHGEQGERLPRPWHGCHGHTRWHTLAHAGRTRSVALESEPRCRALWTQQGQHQLWRHTGRNMTPLRTHARCLESVSRTRLFRHASTSVDSRMPPKIALNAPEAATSHVYMPLHCARARVKVSTP